MHPDGPNEAGREIPTAYYCPGQRRGSSVPSRRAWRGRSRPRGLENAIRRSLQNPLLPVLAPRSPKSSFDFPALSTLVRNLRLSIGMTFLGHESESESESGRNLRHECVIGPLCDHPLFKRKARVYYCILCTWSFLVSGNTVVVLDENHKPVGDEEGVRRFSTFEARPCPVLEGLVEEAFGAMSTNPAIESRRNSDGCRNLATSTVPAWTRGPRPLFRIFSRLREDLGRHQ